MAAGTWSSGGNLATARRYLAGCGTQSAGLSFGGYGPSAVTEEYNGTSWSAGGNLATARYYLAGCGTQSAGLSFGGYDGYRSAVTEEYTIILFPYIRINIGDTWKTVTAIQINIGDSWKDVDMTNSKINIGDVWKELAT